MTDNEIEKARSELMNSYPGCQAKLAEDKKEIVAEISDGFAVAVIERSLPHFHVKTREINSVMRGTLYVACVGRATFFAPFHSALQGPRDTRGFFGIAVQSGVAACRTMPRQIDCSFLIRPISIYILR